MEPPVNFFHLDMSVSAYGSIRVPRVGRPVELCLSWPSLYFERLTRETRMLLYCVAA
jgi:hypothetical protein